MEAGAAHLLVETEQLEALGPAFLLEVRLDEGAGSLPDADVAIHPSYLEAGCDESRYYPHYERPEHGNLLPLPELQKAIAALGISGERLVVVYGTGDYHAMIACRVLWGLLVAGVPDVRLLNGGLQAWRAAGKPIKDGMERIGLRRPAPQVGGEPPRWAPRLEFVATTAEVEEVQRSPESAQVLDIRREGEFNGTITDVYTFFAVAGHVPKSTWIENWDQLVEEDGRLVDPSKLAVKWRESFGVRDGVRLIMLCGTGWRSTIAWLLARLMGRAAANYDDGFYGWTFTGERPIEPKPAPSPSEDIPDGPSK
ncbi:ynjE [Symbiodinium natans]|uniref:YnjE protein n=1 Tax=Symbiodinium natans TaxID=878477 RepID=A0A812PUC2_9DINO|nr:ynjE [Symbiodinium natans]